MTKGQIKLVEEIYCGETQAIILSPDDSYNIALHLANQIVRSGGGVRTMLIIRNSKLLAEIVTPDELETKQVQFAAEYLREVRQ